MPTDGRIILCSCHSCPTEARTQGEGGTHPVRVCPGSQYEKTSCRSQPVGGWERHRMDMGETRLSAIADLQETPCAETAKGHDHMAEWVAASSLQLGRRQRVPMKDLRSVMRDEQTDRSDGGMHPRCSAVELPSFAKPADGKVQLQSHLESWKGPWKRSSCAANSLFSICWSG
jgi:hypothetical protein